MSGTISTTAGTLNTNPTLAIQPATASPVVAPTTPVVSSSASPVATQLGSNLTNTSTANIQKNLGITSDGVYGAQTTAAVKAFQQANNLTPDGIFGPQTQQTYDAKYNGGSSILSTEPIHAQATTDSAALDAALKSWNVNYTPPSPSNGNLNPTGSGGTSTTTPTTNPDGTPKTDNSNTAGIDVSATSTDPFISQLNSMAKTSDTSTNMLIQSAINSTQQKENQATADSQRYQAGLQLMGIQSGGLAANPTITAGGVQEAKNTLLSKISTLEAAKTKAIADAETARDNNNIKILNEKMSYVKEVAAQQKQALADYQTQLTNATVKATADSKAIAGGVYQTLQTLDPADQESFINAIAQQFNIPPATLVSSLADYQTTQTKTSLANANAQATLDKKNNPTDATTKPVKSGTTTFSSDDLQSYQNLITNGGKGPDGTEYAATGSDGYADPGAVVAALKDWTAKGGTAQDFATKFKVSKIVNPASFKLLPEAIRPTITKAMQAKIDADNAASGGSSGRTL